MTLKPVAVALLGTRTINAGTVRNILQLMKYDSSWATGFGRFCPAGVALMRGRRKRKKQ
jgi:hypothetical protein